MNGQNAALRKVGYPPTLAEAVLHGREKPPFDHLVGS